MFRTDSIDLQSIAIVLSLFTTVSVKAFKTINSFINTITDY